MPASVDEIFRQALAAVQAGHIDDAERALRAILRERPGHGPALNVLGIVLMRGGRLAEAEAMLQRAIGQGAASDTTFYNYGILLQTLKRPAEALKQFGQAIAINPAVAEAWNNRGTVLNELARYGAAIADFDRAIALKADYAAAYCNKGKSLAQLEQYDKALAVFDRAVAIAPPLTEAWIGRGNVLAELRRYGDALAAYRRASELNPSLAEAQRGCGDAHAGLGQFADALAAYDKALSLNPHLMRAWIGRGRVCIEFNRFEEALAAYDRAEAANPTSGAPWLGRGIVLYKRQKYDEAAAAYDRALALEPDLAEGWVGRGDVQTAGRANHEAMAAYDRALALRPRSAAAWFGKGTIFTLEKQFEPAFQAYDRAFQIEPDTKFLEGLRLHTKMQLCDWTNHDGEVAHLLEGVRAGKKVNFPFAMLSIATSPTDQLQCARSFIADQPSLPVRRHAARQHDRIRVAYLSADFRDHPVAYLTVGLFECHDKARFETVALSCGPPSGDAWAQRTKAAVDRFVDVEGWTDDRVADLIAELEIDILVDLMGFTQDNRFNVLAMKPAPIQMSYLGYPGSMGASFYDYIVADRVTIPPAQARHYSEKIIYMPETFQANDRQAQDTAAKSFARGDFGVPHDAFVFCCFNANHKITPEVFDSWMRILRQASDSVLWIFAVSRTTEENLKREAAARGVAGERLIFATGMPLPEHQARLRLADLFLDTFPFNGGATTSDALRVGLPILTRAGEAFASRMGASLLTAAGLPDLITESVGGYEAVAVDLAGNPERMAAVKAKLADNLLKAALFDTERFSRHLENAYTAIHARYQRGEPPMTFDVGRLELSGVG